MNEDKVYCACLHVSYKVKEVHGAIWRENWECDSCGREFKKKMGERFNFGDALEQVKKGKAMRLPAWSEDVKIRAQYPDENSKMTAPYLYVESRFGKVPWKETMIELFSEDWDVVE